ncbi:4Fe-4S binding protein [Christensenella tenuis]|jgi:ferredoxin|uniref:4Fe-4S binding protein n=1 Tax=Christensenella tenuis TaxID=2763033 RepID=A0ABR7EH79_9FIRM|nr:4Fe-4S binding protein [Christensenella tenuis]MBC5649043.1 4Fe-4S binding protein [Christensenella tenuis]
MGNVTAIYFSPTGGTKQYVRAVARGLGKAYGEVDLTDKETRAQEHTFAPDDLVVIGVPVYYGRVPQLPDGLLRGLRGNHTPAVLVAVYGNREFDDALLELSGLCEKQGFYGAAAAAFVAQHTFSAKIAGGRPDADDLLIAEEFGRNIKALPAEKAGREIRLPGNRPYRSFQVAPFTPKGDKKCTACGACARACPAGAIAPETPRETDAKKCIRCLACVHVCPVHARRVGGPVYGMLVKKLEKELTKTEKEARLFLP